METTFSPPRRFRSATNAARWLSVAGAAWWSGCPASDFYDAGDNITTKFVDFKDKKWYGIRIRVSDARVEAWIDKEQLVDVQREGHKFGTRFEVDLCQPLGVASWCTAGAVRNIRVRQLKPKEVAAAAAKKED